MRRAALATVVLVLFCGCPRESQSVSSYADLEAGFPLVAHAVVIEHDATYTNYAPVGWVVDPTDNTKFLLYVNKFDHDLDADAKLTVYSGSRSDPYTLTLIGDALTKGAGGSWDARGIYNSGSQVIAEDNGSITALYGGRTGATDYYRIGRAESADGRTFTKYAGNPVLSPTSGTYQSAGAGYQSGIFIKTGGAYYFYVTGVVAVGGPTGTDGQHLTTSPDGVAWTDNGTTVLPLGTLGSYDGTIIEAGQAIVFGSDIAFLYTGYSGTAWTISLARASSPVTPVTKSALNPIFSSAGTHVACPIVANVSGSRWIMYYQKKDVATNTWDVMAAEFATSSGINIGGGVLHGVTLH